MRLLGSMADFECKGTVEFCVVVLGCQANIFRSAEQRPIHRHGGKVDRLRTLCGGEHQSAGHRVLPAAAIELLIWSEAGISPTPPL